MRRAEVIGRLAAGATVGHAAGVELGVSRQQTGLATTRAGRENRKR
ncbi:hypothetical protein ACPXB5_21590 [Micromonospora arida]|nr:hypothetical protein [Micromonospora arida]